MNRLILRLPLSLRILTVALLACTSVVAAAEERVARVLIAVAVGLVAAGAIRVNRSRLALLSVVAMPVVVASLVGGLQAGLAFGHRYAGAATFLLVAAAAVDTIAIEEWLSLFSRVQGLGGGLLSAALIGAAVAATTVTQAVAEDARARAASALGRWAPYPRLTLLLDRVALAFRSVFEVYIDLAIVLSRRRPTSGDNAANIEEAGRQLAIAPLEEVYRFPQFRGVMALAFDSRPVAPAWRRELQRVSAGESVLDVGGGNLRVARLLATQGARIVVVDPSTADVGDRELEGVTILRTRVPFPTGSPFRWVVLHQNVFLELVNQIGLDASCRALTATLTADGCLLLDHIQFALPAEREWRTIYETAVGPQVLYEYFPLGGDDESEVLIRYRLTRPEEERVLLARLRFRVPSLDEVMHELRAAGLAPETFALENQFSFYPGTPVGIRAVRQHMAGL